jgi:hypothetical protein
MPFDLTKHFMLYAIASENFFPHLLPPSRREMEILSQNFYHQLAGCWKGGKGIRKLSDLAEGVSFTF